MKVRGKHVILSLVLLVTGFIIALSYQFANEHQDTNPISQRQWRHEDELRNNIILEQAVNRNLQEDLRGYQAQLREIEAEIADLTEEQEVRVASLIEDLDRLRKIVGTVKVNGPGVEVTLADNSYVPDGANPNDYIVHEEHVHKVVQELLVAGAEAVAINGHRLSHNSFIQCIGPVIYIDGHTSYAPFVVTAIGDSLSLEGSMTLPGGVRDQLVNDLIEVRVQQKNEVIMEPYLSESR
ncbi:hypothetical protein BTR23_04835 [Alkalihalophilus pseudofirmus]|uniref:DUF881 domain-containing protein n=1 Tax=Alkalihalobacterium alkalinitrilicum TaxID=427920 RepID=UPI00094D6C95|nr:DUF881 domain-containing protein [Alkalihalobacterium alkalinitrilicum]OLO40801.1 hypothetical protein BTR23_04835 [Alkalihalophilus pseudofirmus]